MMFMSLTSVLVLSVIALLLSRRVLLLSLCGGSFYSDVVLSVLYRF